MTEGNKERQENELLALESIYDERQFQKSIDGTGGSICVYLDLPENMVMRYTVQVLEASDVSDGNLARQHSQSEELHLDHIPPLIVNFELPDGYPSECPPTFTLSCKWLNVFQISKLCRELDRVWTEQGDRNEILFAWSQFLSDETISVLDIASPFTLTLVSQKFLQKLAAEKDSKLAEALDPRAFQDCASVSTLIPYLTDYNEKETRRVFESSYFDCAVCFTEKRGSDSVQFPNCRHTYCIACMREYFTVQIKDGAVRALLCPYDKCESQADPGLVEKLVSSDLFAKYDKFLLESTLDCMSDVTYCPRPTCQTPVLKEFEESMARCTKCNFTFCFLCKRTYHGVSPCPVNSTELMKLRDQYLKGSPSERAALEKRYGKSRLENAVSEHFSEVWLESNAQKCPSCQTHIQKIDGCNKMTCYKCRSYFCWLCLKILSTSNPYDHFNDQRQGCFNRLFEGIVQNQDFVEFNDDAEEWEFGAWI